MARPKSVKPNPKPSPKGGNGNGGRNPKRVSARRKKEFGGEYLLIDLSLYADDGKTDYTVSSVKTMIKDASIVRRHGAVLDAKEKVCVCLTNWHSEEKKRYLIYANTLFGVKSKLFKSGVRYVLMNQLYNDTESRRKAKYNFDTILPFYEIVAEVPNVMIIEQPRPDLITTALAFRALVKNHNCQKSIYNVLKPGGFFTRFDVQQDGKRRPLPDGFNVGFWYNCMHKRPSFDTMSVPPTKASAFLKRRDLKERRQLLEVFRNGDEFSSVGNRRIAAYSHFKDDKYTISKTQNMKLPGLSSLMKTYPTATVAYPVIDDPFIRLEVLHNVFELISSGLIIQPKQELKQLARITGKNDTQVFMCAFLIAFFKGYVDLRGQLAIKAVIKATQSWSEKLFSQVAWDDGKSWRLPCCEDEGHCLKMAGYQPLEENRRLIYLNKGKADGGECCYRYMMKKYLPEVKIVEA